MSVRKQFKNHMLKFSRIPKILCIPLYKPLKPSVFATTYTQWKLRKSKKIKLCFSINIFSTYPFSIYSILYKYKVLMHKSDYAEKKMQLYAFSKTDT